MTPLRLFVAVVPPAEAVADLAAGVAGHRDEARGLRWSLIAQWHVTLAFLPAVEEDSVDGLVAALAGAGRATPPLRLRVAGAGAFPRPRRARVLWAGLEGDTERLTGLAARCRDAAAGVGVDLSDTRFHPHLTIARAKRAALDVTRLVDALADLDGPEWTAREMRLVRSRLGAGEGHRSAHETVAEVPLTGTAG